MAKKVILTIDDEEHILDLLEYNLEKNGYEVLRAETGEKGLAILKTMQVDLVLLDYLLPGMDGSEVLLSLRADKNLSAMPVIMLTAKGEEIDKGLGLEMGADDYISKPFNAKVLLARCNNLVRNRIILQKKFSQQKNFDAQSLASNPIDQKFLDTVNSIIEKNLDNIDFDMNMMARELGLSRSSLYAKFKALTGMTPNDFVLNCKLKRAAAMLTGNLDLQIADISDRL